MLVLGSFLEINKPDKNHYSSSPMSVMKGQNQLFKSRVLKTFKTLADFLEKFVIVRTFRRKDLKLDGKGTRNLW